MVNRVRVEAAAREGFQRALGETEPVSTAALERLWDALHRWNPDPPDEPTMELLVWRPPLSLAPPPPRLPRRHARPRHRRKRTRTRRWMALLCGLPAVLGLGGLLSALR
ncbi:hypothetical protein M1P56_16825 [Streptomyces sp. HU2014]|uniref:hypothetical protein n=1 Tax=Streptomyces sp. HU2014 TaxID=2939414 RepID=UPI00200C94D6|nr:hypothetical protein [Streptomyces sp. HU2014]UQI45903.1 hypothetical protein M1P56_16825 [Streptomyces sp. HU2014]